MEYNISDEYLSGGESGAYSGDGSGTYSGDVATYGTIALHSCDAGFVLTGGDAVRTCGDGVGVSGVWSGDAPICTRKSLESVGICAFAMTSYHVTAQFLFAAALRSLQILSVLLSVLTMGR